MNLSEINSQMSSLNDWSLDSSSISKNFSFNSFQDANDFINKVAQLAEKQNHHPSIIWNYNLVKISLTTHYENGLTIKDFEFAREIDALENVS